MNMPQLPLAKDRKSLISILPVLFAAMVTALSIISAAHASTPLQTGLGQIPLAPPGVPVMAGFGSFSNNSDEDVVVVSAKSNSFEKVEIHQTTVENDVARMRKIKELVVPAKETVELKHGAMHLMLKNPVAELTPGQHVLIELNLASGDKVTAHFEVMEGLHMKHKDSHDMKKMDHNDTDKKHEGHKLNN